MKTLTNRPVLILALILDNLLGDPPNRFHPVAWMGSLIGFLQRFKPARGPLAQFVYGAGIVAGGMSLAALSGRLLSNLFARLPLPLSWIAEALVLKTAISLRGLDQAAEAVEAALKSGDLPEARRLLSWHLVSRDTSALTSSQVAAATIESVAENASDGVAAPLFYYAIGGLPLALAYRFANTADSMLGYHDREREWLGKLPARLDDLANLLPARLTGSLIVVAALLAGEDHLRAWNVMRRDAAKTESPNAGYPMSAMAGAIGVELEKIGHYRLGARQSAPGAADIRRARRMLFWIVSLATALFFLFSPRSPHRRS